MPYILDGKSPENTQVYGLGGSSFHLGSTAANDPKKLEDSVKLLKALTSEETALVFANETAPAYREDISDLHRMEPWVYSQMIAGKDALRHGEAKNSWLTGTAAWNFVAISQ